jgi:hypothetical protein
VLSLLSFLAVLPVLPFLPLRPLAFFGGTFPLLFTHPAIRTRLPVLIHHLRARAKRARVPERLTRLRDDDALPDAAWRAPLKHVVLFENERRAAAPIYTEEHLSPGSPILTNDDALMFLATTEPAEPTSPVGPGAWGKVSLRAGERAGWTRGADGWSGVGEGEVRWVAIHHMIWLESHSR